MVIIRFNKHSIIQLIPLRRMNNAIVPVFLHLRTKLRTLSDNRLHPLSLLQPPRIHITNSRRSLRKQRHHRQRHGGIGNLTTVHINAAQRHALLPRHGDTLRSPSDRGTHLFHNIRERHISLHALATAPAHRDRAARNCRPADEVAGGARVALHQDTFGGGVRRRGRDEEGGCTAHVASDLYFHSELFHEANRQRHVRRGDEFVLDRNGNVTRGRRCRHEERGKEL
mmetsp:Transcript_44395/g.53674  ORF Transcript_44395/g.53674 Transcript_44395/m.53674 type:complete len:226 (-) Transcript_44395:868-1545(-)